MSESSEESTEDFVFEVNAPEDKDEIVSLEKQCIGLIARNFEQFYFAFTTSKDENLQRRFEFLQRKYSDKLAAALHEADILHDFEFILNEYLTTIYSIWFENGRYINSMQDIFCRLPNLTTLTLGFWGSDVILENVAKFCPKIVEIDVKHSKVTDNGVQCLCKSGSAMSPCPEIKNIFIEGSGVTDRGAECLIQNLPLLEVIDYENVPLLLHSIHNEKLSKFQKGHSYNLAAICLLQFKDFPNYTDVLKTCLTVCPKLKAIRLFITEKEQFDFFKNCQLKELYLKFSKGNKDINIDNLLKSIGGNLTSLSIEGCSISVSRLAVHCPVLEMLEVDNVKFAEEDDEVQLLFPNLKCCFFSKIGFSDSKGFCLLLSSSPKLESIFSIFCTLNLEMKNRILMWCKNPLAQEIGFYNIHLEIKFVRDILLSCPSLKKMDMVCFFDIDDPKSIIYILAKSLPNKPYITLQYSNLFPFDPNSNHPHFFETNPEEVYKSSSVYESLFCEFALKYNEDPDKRNSDETDSDKENTGEENAAEEKADDEKV